jgi:hypothetical protein
VPNTQLFHPDNETLIFGNVPEVNSRGILIPGGPIKLLKGRHNGPNRGFGAAHIWAEHSLEMAKHQCGNVDDVPRYVSLIIQGIAWDSHSRTSDLTDRMLLVGCHGILSK